MRREPELQPELGVVAQFRMAVQRQVVGEQVQVGTEQAFETSVFLPDHAGIPFFQK